MRVITLHPDAKARQFETLMRKEVFPAVRVLRRNVQGISHTLSKSAEAVRGHHLYLWTSVVKLVGGGQEFVTAPLPDDAAKKIAAHGTIATFDQTDFEQPL